MFAQPSIKIARPLNSPRSVRQTPKSKAKFQASRDRGNFSEFEDQETLAKQKYDIINEIIALRKECDTLQGQILNKEADNDERQLLEIEFNNRNSDLEKNLSEHQRRVLVYSKQLNHLQTEMNELVDKHNFLSTYFSEDAIVRLKSEIVYEKHTIGHQRDELRAVMQVRDSAQAELDSNDLTIGIQMCHSQRTQLAQLKKDLRAVQDEEGGLAQQHQETLRLPKEIEAQESEIKELNQRLKNLIHSKDSRNRDLDKLKELNETEKSVMDNVQHIVKVQKSRERERENYSSTVTSSRGMRTKGRAGRVKSPITSKKQSRKSTKDSGNEMIDEIYGDDKNKSKTLSDDFENDFDKTGGTISNDFDNDFEKTGGTLGDDDFDNSEEKKSNKSSDNDSNKEKSGSEKEGSGSGSEKEGSDEEKSGSGSEKGGSDNSDSEKDGSDEEKDSDEKDSEEKDSDFSDSDKKDSDEKDSDFSDSDKKNSSDTDEMEDRKNSDESDGEKSEEKSDDDSDKEEKSDKDESDDD